SQVKLPALVTDRATFLNAWTEWAQARHSQRIGPSLAAVGPQSGMQHRVRIVAEKYIHCMNNMDQMTFREVTDVPFTLVAGNFQNNGYGGMVQPGGTVLTTRAALDQYYAQMMANM